MTVSVIPSMDVNHGDVRMRFMVEFRLLRVQSSSME